MATISTSAFNDAAARSAGESITINSGAVWTVRTDYRHHANAPASNLGSMDDFTVTEGEWVWDSSNTRWLAYNSGTGNVPAIGTTISKGGVSGYLLGVWAAVNVLPTAVGAAMPTSGFIKFREVSNGPFSSGALSGIGASATGPDVQGWLSYPHDIGANFTIPRLGKHTARGGRFFLDDTTGVRGQTFQIPSDGSASVLAPGLMVETAVGSDQYEFWPALNGATNGWSHLHVGNATGTTDVRQKFLKAEAGGAMRMGETWSVAATYASLAAQASTYAQISVASCPYTWVGDVIEVFVSAGHQVETGQQVGLDFTSGGATAHDGLYTVTVLDAYRFSVPRVGSGAGGVVTFRPGVTVSFAAHGLNVGESVYCDFTSGTGVDGTYEIYAVTATGTYLIKYPSATAITSGAVSCLHTLVITSTAHGLAQGQTVYCGFTSGAATIDGVYVAQVVAANTININYPHSAAITASNVTISRDVGFVSVAGLRTWIGSNILHEVSTTTRQNNAVPNATSTNRPEWLTTAAGAIDLEYVYATSCLVTMIQAYSVRIRNCIFVDQAWFQEVATDLDIDGCYVGMLAGTGAHAFNCSNNYAGGSVKNVKAFRGLVAANGHAASINYCNGIIFENLECGIIQYARSTGYPISVTYCQDVDFNNPRCLNGQFIITASQRLNINNLDFSERFSGNGLAASNGVNVGAGSADITVDGITFGYGGLVPNTYPLNCLYSIGSTNIKLRNVGSLASPIPLPTWAPNLSTPTNIFLSGGSNNNVKVQRVFLKGVKTAPFVSVNSDKNMLYETCQFGNHVWSSKAILGVAYADLNGTIKNCYAPNSVTGQASVYGTHFADHFLGTDYGRFWLNCNEPTEDTAAQFTNVVGTAKFNSSGGVIVQTTNDQCYFTDNVFRKGHTGFNRTEVVMSGGTLTNYNLHYQIDLGSGFSDWKNLYYQRAGGSGTSGQFTFTVTDATGVVVGDYCFGTGLSTVGLGCKNAAIPRVTQVVGNTITVDVANTGTVSGVIRFTQLPSEVVDPAIGFKMRWRITTVATATAAITHIRVETISSAAAQDNYYPLDTNTITFTGLPTGTDMVVLEAGTENILYQVDAYPGTSISYQYSGADIIDVGFIKPGYVPFYLRDLAITTVDLTLPVALSLDRNYK